MTVDRVASPSHLTDGTPVGAGGNPDHVVIGSDEDRKAHPELYEDEAAAEAVTHQAKVDQRQAAPEKATSV